MSDLHQQVTQQFGMAHGVEKDGTSGKKVNVLPYRSQDKPAAGQAHDSPNVLACTVQHLPEEVVGAPLRCRGQLVIQQTIQCSSIQQLAACNANHC